MSVLLRATVIEPELRGVLHGQVLLHVSALPLVATVALTAEEARDLAVQLLEATGWTGPKPGWSA